MNLDLYLVYGLVVLYALCYQLQSPVEPFLVDKLLNASSSDSAAESAAAYGRLKSFFSITQSFGSLAFGYLLDKFGVRRGLAINFLACATCYYILSITDSIEMLYLSRVPGIAMAGFLCAQTAIIKLTKPGSERLVAMGRLTTSYTIGGVMGPYLGGQLGKSGDYSIGARYATYGSLLCVALVFALPESIDAAAEVEPESSKKEKKSQNSSGASSSWIGGVWSVLSLVWLYLFVKLVSSIGNSMARSAQPLILKELGVDEARMGMIMSAQFAFGGFANGFLLKPVTAMLGGHVSVVVRNCILVMGAVYVIQALNYSSILPIGLTGQEYFIGAMMFLAIFQYSLGTSITTKTSSIVPKKMQGTLMGMEHSLFAVAYMVGPTAGVSALTAGGIAGLSATCGAIFFVVLTVWFFFHDTKEDSDDDMEGGEDEGEDKKSQ
jgi:MFS family permease